MHGQSTSREWQIYSNSDDFGTLRASVIMSQCNENGTFVTLKSCEEICKRILSGNGAAAAKSTTRAIEVQPKRLEYLKMQ
jgi:hypothetical protein